MNKNDTVAVYGTSEGNVMIEFRSHNVSQASAKMDIAFTEEVIKKLKESIKYARQFNGAE